MIAYGKTTREAFTCLNIFSAARINPTVWAVLLGLSSSVLATNMASYVTWNFWTAWSTIAAGVSCIASGFAIYLQGKFSEKLAASINLWKRNRVKELKEEGLIVSESELYPIITIRESEVYQSGGVFKVAFCVIFLAVTGYLASIYLEGLSDHHIAVQKAEQSVLEKQFLSYSLQPLASSNQQLKINIHQLMKELRLHRECIESVNLGKETDQAQVMQP